MTRSNIYWVHLKHGDATYGGGTICFPNDPQPATFSIKCRLCADGKFHVLEGGCAAPYRRGYIIPADSIAYFMHEDDFGYNGDLGSKIDQRYLYDIFKANITRTPCQQAACSFHNS